MNVIVSLKNNYHDITQNISIPNQKINDLVGTKYLKKIDDNFVISLTSESHFNFLVSLYKI